MTDIFFKRAGVVSELKLRVQELIEEEGLVVYRGEVDGDIRYIEVPDSIEIQDLIDRFVNCYREA